MPGSALPAPGRQGRRRPSGPACGRPTSRCSVRTATSRCAGSRSAWSSSARSSAASFPSTRRPTPAPIVVHVFGSERAYQPFMPLFNGKRVDVGGYFQPTSRRLNYITLSTREPAERAYPTIFHEYVHLLVGTTLRRRAGVVQRGAGRVLQHVPDATSRSAHGDARPSSRKTHVFAAPRALHPARRAPRRRSHVADVQRGRPPRHLLRRVVGPRALPADRQPRASRAAHHLPAGVRRGHAARPPRCAKPSASPKRNSSRSCGRTSTSRSISRCATPSRTRWRSTRTGGSTS